MIGNLLEIGMLLCFAASWPFNIRKSYISRTAVGRSIAFELIIEMGYFCGVARKFVMNDINYVLAFYFLDTTEESNPHRFKPIHAELIYEFFRSIPDGADLFVCCDAGESRSAAIAAALKVAQGESDAEIWNSPEYHPNPLVYRTCRETFFDPGI